MGIEAGLGIAVGVINAVAACFNCTSIQGVWQCGKDFEKHG